jgi:membrane-bound transcription factor site-1 protease
MWTPFMAGANIPSINSLLDKYHIAFGEKVVSGDFYIDKR